jgi:acetyltransferase-like isoleucine patch superfamily enzyme
MSLPRALKKLIPSGIRELRLERQWRRHHGLVDQGETTGRWISPSSSFGRNCRVNGRVHIVDSTIGDWSYVEMDARLMGARIGRFSAVGPTAQIGLPGHPVSTNVSMHPAFYQHRPGWNYDLLDADLHDDLQPTIVGNDVWIGAGALVLDGVSIGDGAVVGAGAVVTKDVPPYAVVAGSPARVLRHRFDEETVEWLLALRWWDRPEDWLRRHAGSMHDIATFRGRLSSGDPVLATGS